MNIEKVIFKSLLTDDVYVKKVLPYLSEDYFSEKKDKILFNEIKTFVEQYGKIPTPEILEINVSAIKGFESEIAETVSLVKELDENIANTGLNDHEWTVNKTEEFCKDKALYNAVLDSINIIDGKNKDKKTKGSIPELLSNALSICFDPNIGHDYTEDIQSRYEYYHKKQKHIPFDIDSLNKITNGGVIEKTLNLLMASTGIGKTLCMCHFASAYIVAGYDVLYITMEISQEEIAKRIDANLLNVNMDDLVELPEDTYKKKIAKMKSRVTGRLIVKEYPTGSANTNHFRALLNELKIKKNFRPKIIFIDYLNICSSARKKGSENSYEYNKSIAEELRGLGVEFNAAIWSATQTNRGGYGNSEPGLENTSDSIGVPMTVDFMAVLVSDDNLAKLNQFLLIQLKNRYRDKDKDRKIMIGVDKAKQKLYDCEQSAQTVNTDIDYDSPPIMDRKFGNTIGPRDYGSIKFNN